MDGERMRMPDAKEPTTDFELAVHKVVQRVPRGHVITYGDAARRAGRPGAARAVGNVMRCNPDTDATPCHRVVRSDGLVGGYGGGWENVERKIKLLRREGVHVDPDGRIQDFPEVRVR